MVKNNLVVDIMKKVKDLNAKNLASCWANVVQKDQKTISKEQFMKVIKCAAITQQYQIITKDYQVAECELPQFTDEKFDDQR